VFVLGDLMPPLRRLLSSEGVRRVTTTGKFAELLARGDVDPAQALAALEANAAYVPSEVTIAFPSATYDSVISWMKTALVLGLSSGATDEGGDAVDGELPKLQELLVEAVGELEIPQFTVWVRFRDPQVAQRAFAAVEEVAAPLGERTGLQATVEDNSIHVKFTMGEMMPPEAFPAILVGAGMAPDPDDPELRAAGEAMAQFEAEITLERHGDGLLVIVGPRPRQAAPYPADELGPLWKADESLLAFGKWRIVAFKTGFRDLVGLWNDWRDTASGKALASFDEEDILADLTRIASNVGRAADAGAAQVTLGEALEAIVHEQGAEPADPLADSPILAFLPRDAEAAAVSSAASLGDHLSDLLYNFEDRLSRNSLKAELSSRRDQAELLDRWSKFYYGRLDDFRRLVHDESRERFAPPVVALGGSRGAIERLEITFDDAQGEPNRVTLRNAPMIEYATIARMADARAKDFPNGLVRAFLSAYFDDLPDSIVEARELGLGVETFAFTADLFGRLPNNVSVAVEGDLVPHFFVVDDWLVFSTSVRLSKSVLAAHADAAARRPAPDVDAGALVAFGFFPANLVAEYLEHFGEILGALAHGEGMVELDGPTVELLRNDEIDTLLDAFPAMAEAVRLVDAAEWTTVDRDADLRETRFRATFAE
jgi:hypothetical protein